MLPSAPRVVVAFAHQGPMHLFGRTTGIVFRKTFRDGLNTAPERGCLGVAAAGMGPAAERRAAFP